MDSWDRRNNAVLLRLATALGADDEPVVATSGNVASAAAVATIPAVEDKVAHLLGFRVQGLGATAGLAVAVTIAGVAGGLLSYAYVAEAGVLVHNEPLDVTFPFPLAAPNDETEIVITCPDLGDGNTNNTVVAYGVYRAATAAQDT